MTNYATYALGKDDFTIDPNVRAIRVKSVNHTSVEYEITYSVPVELLPDAEGEA